MGLEFDELIDTADGRVVESWAMSGVHSGEAFGLPPSGQRVRVRGVEIFRCADGKIVEHWGAVDMSDFIEKAMGAGGSHAQAARPIGTGAAIGTGGAPSELQ